MVFPSFPSHSQQSENGMGSVECNDVKELYDLGLWPEGAFVRRFYEVRKPRATVSAVNEPGVSNTK